jgi:hypothetical protein
MLQDIERYILTTDKPSVMRNVLSLVSEGAGAEGVATQGSGLCLDTAAKDGCDKMILELRRPKGPAAGIFPRIRNLRTSRFGRVLVVTGDATVPELFREIDVLRHPYSPRHLGSGLLAFGRTIFCSLRLSDPQN